jgi:hypothetical protein
MEHVSPPHLIDAQGTIRDAVPSPITGERARLGIKRAATAR